MHIEPGIVDGAKTSLSYLTAAGSLGIAGIMALDIIRSEGVGALAIRTSATSILVFSFFEVLPHHAAGVSEVHLILGSTLFLIFGGGATAPGARDRPADQGIFFAQFDLPQSGMNITTLIVLLYAISFLAKRLIPENTAYKDVGYRQAFALPTAYRGGIVLLVAFWSIYGGGFSGATLSATVTFGAAYMLVVLLKPLIDLAVLALTKFLARHGRCHCWCRSVSILAFGQCEPWVGH